MKQFIYTLLVIALGTVSCGKLSMDSKSEETDVIRGFVETGTGESYQEIEQSITGQVPVIAQQALEKLAAKGIVPATCPSGMDKACADALFLALLNTRAIKTIATRAQTSLVGNTNGSTFNLYSARASQPAVNTGFAIVKSNFYAQQKNVSNPWTGSLGELILTNTQSLQAGIAAYTFLTNKTSAIGIAGGYAGASLYGWTEGVFYCYLVLSGGVPVGYCDAAALSGGW